MRGTKCPKCKDFYSTDVCPCQEIADKIDDFWIIGSEYPAIDLTDLEKLTKDLLELDIDSIDNADE